MGQDTSGDGLRLRNLTVDDLALYEAVHCDPAMMEHLGGPLPKAGLAEKIRRDVASIASGEARVFVIEPDGPGGSPAGTIAIWEHDQHRDPIVEIGWMVLPPFQGRGVGTAAVRAALDLVRAEGRWHVVHAFPPVTNPGSNAMCRRMGFSFVEEREYFFRDRPLRCNHWSLDLREG
jgi:RimJ/RimL family protein N-acetyltransferase